MAEPRVVAVVQARMGSTRVPGKVLLPLAGTPVVEHVVGRLRRARRLHHVVVATSTASIDDELAAVLAARGIAVCRGSESDVLERYAQAAREARADVVVRITADCPLIDWVVLDELLVRYGAALARGERDYASNTLERTYPRGLDVEAFSRRALEQAAAEATAAADREHVTRFFYTNPRRFRLAGIRNGSDLSRHRWTLDTAEDYALLAAVFERLGGGGHEPTTAEVLALLRARPDLVALNAHVEQKR
jgi:spore coat polysaccharide biosynthesis protein SpsF